MTHPAGKTGKDTPHKTESYSRLRRALLWLWVVWMVAVCCLSLLPQSVLQTERSALFGLTDKQQHYLSYVLLGFLPMAGFRHPATGGWAGASMVLLGVVLEFCQLLFTTDRSFDGIDMLANTFGVLTGVALALAARRIAARASRHSE